MQELDEFAAACIQLAERIEASNTTLIDTSFAIIIQKLAYESLGPADKLSEVERRQQQLNDRLQSQGYEESIILLADPRVLADYTAEFAAKGELAAMDFAEQETERLLADPDYDPCALIAEPEVEAIPDP